MEIQIPWLKQAFPAFRQLLPFQETVILTSQAILLIRTQVQEEFMFTRLQKRMLIGSDPAFKTSLTHSLT